MICYECARQGIERPAVGTCHNCSIGVCIEHGARVKTLVGHSTGKSFAAGEADLELPEEAERLLCSSCARARKLHSLAKIA